ncbi:MAG: endonuclease/exonuclease/phosphatase family protein [Verrucomicrobia bacterium]|nr:endonuclease/exonuclease/phosphatase family protein [Verrucomicrobiota bacterium]
MKHLLRLWFCILLFRGLLVSGANPAPLPPGKEPNRDTFKVMSYNVHNYLLIDRDHDGRENDPKPDEEKEALFTIITEESPDVLALVEVGSRKFLGEIQDGLCAKGDEYAYSEWIEGTDRARHVCLLSRFPIVAREPHTRGEFRLGDKMMGVSRGFIEADIQASPQYRLKAYVAHLKSKRAVEIEGGAEAIRMEEARLFRQYINEDLAADPNINLIAMGDFNDTPDSPAIRHILADTQFPLFDLRPRNAKGYEGTYYYRPKKSFERIDYLLVSQGLKHEYIAGSAKIRDDKPAWKASDHFSVQASFHIGDLDGAPPSSSK